MRNIEIPLIQAYKINSGLIYEKYDDALQRAFKCAENKIEDLCLKHGMDRAKVASMGNAHRVTWLIGQGVPLVYDNGKPIEVELFG